MKEIRVYFEGDRKLRRGFRNFFGKRFGASCPIKCLPYKSKVIEGFLNGCIRWKDTFNVLLIDADVLEGSDFKMAVKNRPEWKKKDVRASDEQLHFMVQCMETWFLADKQALSEFYGDQFKVRSSPQTSDVEEIQAKDVIKALKKASKKNRKGKYRKSEHPAHILTLLDPHKVAAQAPHCRQLFDAIEVVLREEDR